LLKDETLFAKRGLRVPCPVLALLALIGLALFSTYALAETGAEIYKARCSACHAASGAGDTMLGKNMKLRALGSPDVQKQSDQELAAIISRGKNRMPAYERRLTRDQIAAVVRYIRTLKP
jgi:cytochrome c6